MIRSFFRLILPPPQWRLPVAVVSGALFGIVGAILIISNAVSYASDEPEACINCHVMNTHYVTWQKGSHARVATCNDCHVPHDNVFRKYGFKAMDGLRHSAMFTFRLEPQVIRIHSMGSAVVQENCLRCHGNKFSEAMPSQHPEIEGRVCWTCHKETPHGKVSSLSTVSSIGIDAPWMSKDSTTKAIIYPKQ